MKCLFTWFNFPKMHANLLVSAFCYVLRSRYWIHDMVILTSLRLAHKASKNINTQCESNADAV